MEMKKAAILMIGNYLTSPRHNRNVWHGLSERLPELGWIVTTASSKEVQVFRLLDMLWTVIRQRKDYSLAQIDVFSGRAFIFAEWCSFILRLLKKPIILTLHGGRLPEFANQYPKRVQLLLNWAQIVVTPSPFLKKKLMAFRDDIHLIPNAINLSSAIYRIRKKATPNMIWVRAFHEIYNPSLAPKVIKALEQDFPDIHLAMLGPDKGDGSLEKMKLIARNLDIEKKIDVIGSVKKGEIPTWLDKADIFINTTNYDAFPRSMLEAMANGLCIVSTNVGGIPYMIEDYESGLLVPPNDPFNMANAIRSIIVDPKIANYLSINARKRVEVFDWSVVLPMWDNLLQGVISRSNE